MQHSEAIQPSPPSPHHHTHPSGFLATGLKTYCYWEAANFLPVELRTKKWEWGKLNCHSAHCLYKNSADFLGYILHRLLQVFVISRVLKKLIFDIFLWMFLLLLWWSRFSERLTSSRSASSLAFKRVSTPCFLEHNAFLSDEAECWQGVD